MDTPVQIDVAMLDARQRLVLEEIIGRPLAANQRLTIRIRINEVELPPKTGETLAQTLEDWTNVYDGPSDEEVAAIEEIVLDRSGWTRNVD